MLACHGIAPVRRAPAYYRIKASQFSRWQRLEAEYCTLTPIPFQARFRTHPFQIRRFANDRIKDRHRRSADSRSSETLGDRNPNGAGKRHPRESSARDLAKNV